MTNTILLKMQEKEKKTEKKPTTNGEAKGLKRNKTTVNLGRNKLNKGENSEKPVDNKLRKSMAIKGTESDVKKPKLISMSMRTEPNEKKENININKKNEKNEKKDLSKTLAKSMIKSKTVARLSPKKNKKELTPSKKSKKENNKKDTFKTEDKKNKEEKKVDKKDEKKEDKNEEKKSDKKEDKKKDKKEGKKDEKKEINKEEKKDNKKGDKKDDKKDKTKKEEKKKEEPKKDDKKEIKKDDKVKKEIKKDDKTKKEDKKEHKKDDKIKKDEKIKKEEKPKKEDKTKKDEKKDDKKKEKKIDKKNKQSEDKKEEKIPEDKKKEEKKEEAIKEEVKTEDKKEEIKTDEKKEEVKAEEKKEEVKAEEKKEEVKTEEKKEEPKENPEVKNEDPPKEENKEESMKKEEEIEKKEEPQEQEKKEETKITGKPKTILLMKFVSILDKYSKYLIDEDIYIMGKVCKKFNKPCLEILKEINNQKLEKEEKELETINSDGSKLVTEFSLGKAAVKALGSLNDKVHTEYFQKEEAPGEEILLTYRILYQLINKEKNILEEKDGNKFWKLFRENLLKNSEKGIGDYIQNEFINLDFSEENIHKLHILCEGREERLGPINIGKKDVTAKFICFLIKEPLEYIKIVIGTSKNKKVNNSEVYKKYLEYIIKKRKEDKEKLDKLISKA